MRRPVSARPNGGGAVCSSSPRRGGARRRGAGRGPRGPARRPSRPRAQVEQLDEAQGPGRRRARQVASWSDAAQGPRRAAVRRAPRMEPGRPGDGLARLRLLAPVPCGGPGRRGGGPPPAVARGRVLVARPRPVSRSPGCDVSAGQLPALHAAPGMGLLRHRSPGLCGSAGPLSDCAGSRPPQGGRRDAAPALAARGPRSRELSAGGRDRQRPGRATRAGARDRRGPRDPRGADGPRTDRRPHQAARS